MAEQLVMRVETGWENFATTKLKWYWYCNIVSIVPFMFINSILITAYRATLEEQSSLADIYLTL